MNTSIRKKILILDDHPIINEAVESIVKSISINFDTISFCKQELAHRYILENKVDMLILDIQLDQGDGFSFLRNIRDSGFSGRVIFFTALDSTSYRNISLKMGVNAFCSKSVGLNELKKTIIKSFTSRNSHSKKVSSKKEDVVLSQRETIVLSFLLKGIPNKVIADRLDINPKTVSTYKTRILKKYGVGNLMELKVITMK